MYYGYDYDLDELYHYGTPRHSGRYPWGSGDDPFQHESSWLKRYKDYQKSGMDEAQIAAAMDISLNELRRMRQSERAYVNKMRDDTIIAKYERGMNGDQIGKEMGIPGGTVRSVINRYLKGQESVAQRQNMAVDLVKEEMAKCSFMDVGKGVAAQVGISQTMMDAVLKTLQKEGYMVVDSKTPRVTTEDDFSKIKVLISPEIAESIGYDEKKAKHLAYVARDNNELHYYQNDKALDPETGEIKHLQYPASIDSKRVAVRYADDGGLAKDGVMEIRRNVADLSLGDSSYAQVRILVDGTHYLKGMAIYSDNLPDGVDVLFNTNKTSDIPLKGPKSDTSVLKPVKEKDAQTINPFGAYIPVNGQSEYTDENGVKHLSAINKLKEEGDWNEQKVRIPAQMLSKQDKPLVQRQLSLTVADYKDELDELQKIPNPAVRQKMLEDFADTCETVSVHLYAKAFPKQRTQVILPLENIKDTEIYAPNYENGEKVALIRYPHGSTEEIPILTVNNHNAEGNRVYGPSMKDGVGINSRVAARLSGADFDGDTVTVIPTGKGVDIRNRDPNPELTSFEPKVTYAKTPGMKVMTKDMTQKEMGKVSNLITDMTIKGAPLSEITKAIKHSMVVIDAEKHVLDYKRSESDNEIERLKTEWQTHVNPITGNTERGASTLISMAKNEQRVPLQDKYPKQNKETGEYIYTTSKDAYYVDKNGKERVRTTEKYKRELVKDAHELSSGTAIEELYANYSNAMASMANQARKEAWNTSMPKVNKQAAETYSFEVDSINAKLNKALKNKPNERQANIIATNKMRELCKEYPTEFKLKYGTPEQQKAYKKKAQTYLDEARVKVGSKSYKFDLSDKEYEAINAGALSGTKVKEIIKYVDKDSLMSHVSPRERQTIKPSQVARMNTLEKMGYTREQIADALRVSISAIDNYLNESKE